MKKNLILLGTVLSAGPYLYLNGMETFSRHPYHMYEGQTITPETIANLMPKMPELVGSVVALWADDNKDLLQAIVPKSSDVAMSQQEIVVELLKSAQAFEKKGINIPTRDIKISNGIVAQTRKIPAGCSYIIELPYEVEGKKYFVKISGPLHKKHNLLTYNSKAWEGSLDPNEDKKTATFQTVSTGLNALKTGEFIERESIKGFHIPDTYLDQIPGRKDIHEFACDENTLVVQEDRGKEYVGLRDNLRLLGKVSPKTINEIYKVIKGGVLWDVGGNVLINVDDYTLGQSDLEQPNNQSPTNFAYCNEGEHTRYMKLSHDKVLGIEGFAGLLNDALKKGYDVSDQCEVYGKLVQEDLDKNSFISDFSARLHQCAEFERLK